MVIRYRAKAAALKAAVSGCLVIAIAGASAPALAQTATTDAVPVYDATEVAFDGYSVIRRLGIDGWRSAFRIRGHRDLASARQALVNEAARLGADGVVNLVCLGQTDAPFFSTGYYCYGNAIKVKKQ